jgi:hypothetical protein
VTRVTPTPKHGTVQRYRLELKERRAGNGPGPCDRCRAANSNRAKRSRADAAALRRRAGFSIVDEVTESVTSGVTQDDETENTADTSPAKSGDPTPGPMEQAVEADIGEISTDMRVPFHRSLSVLALQIAREIDDTSSSASSRSANIRQLHDVLKSLRTKNEGDATGAVEAILGAAGFGTPLVALPSGGDKPTTSRKKPQ